MGAVLEKLDNLTIDYLNNQSRTGLEYRRVGTAIGKLAIIHVR